MKVFKGLLALLFLSVLFLAGCGSIEHNAHQTNGNTPAAKSLPQQPSSAVDPADNAKRITLEEARALWEKDKDSIVFVDTRGDAAFKEGHIKGAILLNDFMNRASEFKDKTIITYCT